MRYLIKQSKTLKVISRHSGFTIVELLVVIVVIGILSAITIVSYSGISSRAKIAALQSDLNNAAKQLKIYQINNGTYPTSVTDCPTPATSNVCLKASGGASYTQYVSSANTFTLVETASDGVTSWQISDNSGPTAVGGEVVTLVAPTLSAVGCPLNLMWATITDATSYTVQYATDSAFTANVHLVQSINATYYVVPADNITYYFHARAVNGADVSSWSNVISGQSTSICM